MVRDEAPVLRMDHAAHLEFRGLNSGMLLLLGLVFCRLDE